MANRLMMAMVQSIPLLHTQGSSQPRIAGELGVDCETVSRYVELNQHSSAACEPNGGNADHPRVLKRRLTVSHFLPLLEQLLVTLKAPLGIIEAK